jgi:hypothetical protein
VVLLASGGVFWLIYLAIVVAYVAGFWVTFTKAGQPGWAAIIPFYNLYVLLKVVGRPGWWLILYFIPFLNFVIHIIVMLDLAKSFRQGTGFAIGLIFLPFIFIPILGFGDASYAGRLPAAHPDPSVA